MKQPSNTDTMASNPAKNGSIWRFLPIGLIALAAAVFFASGAYRYLSVETLKEHYISLEAFVEENFIGALALYIAAYVVVTALSLPGATLMSVLGGFLFGIVIGTMSVVVAATIGATIIFVAARTAFGEFFREKVGGVIKRLEAGFNENAFSYLLLLRLIPVFPFFIVNVVPAFTKIRTGTFVLATFIGIIPGAFAFVSAGNGLGAILARGGELKLTGLLTQPEVLTPIVALSALALLPIIFRAVQKTRHVEPDV